MVLASGAGVHVDSALQQLDLGRRNEPNPCAGVEANRSSSGHAKGEAPQSLGIDFRLQLRSGRQRTPDRIRKQWNRALSPSPTRGPVRIRTDSTEGREPSRTRVRAPTTRLLRSDRGSQRHHTGGLPRVRDRRIAAFSEVLFLWGPGPRSRAAFQPDLVILPLRRLAFFDRSWLQSAWRDTPAVSSSLCSPQILVGTRKASGPANGDSAPCSGSRRCATRYFESSRYPSMAGRARRQPVEGDVHQRRCFGSSHPLFQIRGKAMNTPPSCRARIPNPARPSRRLPHREVLRSVRRRLTTRLAPASPRTVSRSRLCTRGLHDVCVSPVAVESRRQSVSGDKHSANISKAPHPGHMRSRACLLLADCGVCPSSSWTDTLSCLKLSRSPGHRERTSSLRRRSRHSFRGCHGGRILRVFSAFVGE